MAAGKLPSTRRASAMSKDLHQYAAELEDKAARRAKSIRRAVDKYNFEVKSATLADLDRQRKRQRQIEREVARYTELNKALKRIRKKMRIRSFN
jgi:hypothetical protein